VCSNGIWLKAGATESREQKFLEAVSLGFTFIILFITAEIVNNNNSNHPNLPHCIYINILT
jgi:hypothetical protein